MKSTNGPNESACKFCGEALSRSALAKKCKACGEPQGWRVYFWGMILKYIPLASALSVVVALASLYIAYLQQQATQRAEIRRDAAQAQKQTVERASNQAIERLTRQLPEHAKQNILRSLDLRPHTNLNQLENEVEKAPLDSQKREKLFLYRALKSTE
jgi:hypothetical protein